MVRFVRTYGAAGTALLLATQVYAALPEDASTSIATYKADATTAIGLVMGAGVVIWGLLKLASKLGWR